MTYNEYLEAVLDNRLAYRLWREGQTYFNTLAQINQGLAETLVATEADCFYDDSRVPAFLVQVHRYYEAFGSVTDERRSNI